MKNINCCNLNFRRTSKILINTTPAHLLLMTLSFEDFWSLGVTKNNLCAVLRKLSFIENGELTVESLKDGVFDQKDMMNFEIQAKDLFPLLSISQAKKFRKKVLSEKMLTVDRKFFSELNVSEKHFLEMSLSLPVLRKMTLSEDDMKVLGIPKEIIRLLNSPIINLELCKKQTESFQMQAKYCPFTKSCASYLKKTANEGFRRYSCKNCRVYMAELLVIDEWRRVRLAKDNCFTQSSLHHC